MAAKYFISRASVRSDGSISAPVETKNSYAEGESLFLIRAGQACAAVADGSSVSEAVVWFSDDGFVLDHKGWVSTQPEPEET